MTASSRRVCGARTSDGYVTLAVLLMVGLLAVLVSSLMAISRPALGLARIGAEQIVADALAEGGLNAAAFLLFGLERAPGRVDGLLLRRQTGSVRLSVADESGRIDLNSAEPELLAGLFEAAGGSSLRPDAFAGRIVDWRDDDDEISDFGAEAGEYESAGSPYRPPNRPFRAVDQLRLLLGLSPADFALLQPFLTVFNPDGLIDPFSAPATVLRAVPEITDADIRLIMAGRNSEDLDRFYEVIDRYSDYVRSYPSGVYRVGVAARLGTGFTSTMEAVIVEPPDDSVDYGVVAWSRLAAAASPR